MADSNKYIDMSAKEALKLAKDKYLLLPDIQREYVWSMEDIEKLFESIVDGYPIGSCIFWKTNKKTLNAEKPNLYFFLREFKREESKNEKASEVFGEEGDYYIVLDGQQRITSLNIALYGSYTCYKGGRGRSKSDPKYWITRELYYNLDYYKNEEDEEKDDENPPKRFSFLTKEDANNGNYYKVKNILAFDDDRALLRELIKAGYEEIIQNDLCRLFSRIHSSGSDDIVQEAVRHTKRTHPKRNIIVDMYDEIIPVMADANLIVQVIVNLMDNAVKYSDEDSDVTVSVRRENAHTVVISVSDHGTGISDEEKEKVFDMFYTGGSRSSDSRRSLGLGLALCRSIITSHGGTISVSDNIPNGTVVSFTLPIGEVNLNE